MTGLQDNLITQSIMVAKGGNSHHSKTSFNPLAEENSNVICYILTHIWFESPGIWAWFVSIKFDDVIMQKGYWKRLPWYCRNIFVKGGTRTKKCKTVPLLE